MPTQKTTYGYPYPQPVDPVRDGAVAIQGLAMAIRPHSYPGAANMPPLAGAFTVADLPNMMTVHINVTAATDQYGLFTVALPFSKALCWISAMVTDFRLDADNPVIAMEGMTSATQGTFFVRKPSNGQGHGNLYVPVSITAIGV